MNLEEVLNTSRYPLDKLGSDKGQQFVSSIKAGLDNDGSYTLPHFVTDKALNQLLTQSKTLVDLAYPGPTEVSPYFFNYQMGANLGVDNTHPVRRKGRRNLSQVAGDLIPGNHLLRQIFESDLIAGLLARVLGVAIYRNADTYQGLNLSVMNQGGCQQWHFDSGNMVTTLLLQEPEAGGEFEYAPNIRSEQNENFDEVRKVLDGHSDKVKQLKLRAGTLSLFRGRYSMHRVSEVKGDKQRLQAILGYTTAENLTGSLESSVLHYGPRVASIESAREPRVS